jgi:hypothetical protein
MFCVHEYVLKDMTTYEYFSRGRWYACEANTVWAVYVSKKYAYWLLDRDPVRTTGMTTRSRCSTKKQHSKSFVDINLLRL